MQNKGRQSRSTSHVTLPFNCEFVMTDIVLCIPGGVGNLPDPCALHVQRPHIGDTTGTIPEVLPFTHQTLVLY